MTEGAGVRAPEVIEPAIASRTTRRALLGAGVGAFVAAALGALGRPQAARADNNQIVTVGNAHTTSLLTLFSNRVNDNNVLGGESEAGGTGILGTSKSSNGVQGISDSGIGVHGRSNTDKGVYGFSNSGPGVYAYSGAGNGTWGYTAARDGHAGMVGQSEHEEAFGGFATNIAAQTAVYLAGAEAAVLAVSPSTSDAVALQARAGILGTGLVVEGKARFNRSGKANVPAGKSFVDVTVAGGVTGGSIVVATPMLNRAGVYVQSAVPNPATGRVRISLNKVPSSSSSTPVGWVVLD